MTRLAFLPPPAQRRSLLASRHCTALVAAFAVAVWSPARALAAAPASDLTTTSDPEKPTETEDVPISPVTPAPDGAEAPPVATEQVEPSATPLPVTPDAAASVPVPAHEHAHDHGVHEHQHRHERGARGAKDARVPGRMSPMQKAGWWSLLGAFVLTATAATLGGVSAREQGRRRRLELKANPPDDDPARETEAQLEAQTDIERSRERGRAYGVGATIVGGVAAATALAGVVVLVVDAAKRRPASARRAWLGPSGMQVRF